MKIIVCTAFVLLFIIYALVDGQQTQFPDGSQPATSNVRGAVYPRITPDLRAIFQIKAMKWLKTTRVYGVLQPDL
jgi:hypothetical protein